MPLYQLSEGEYMLCFDPSLKLRKAESNIYCYAIDPVAGEIIKQRILHPIDAVLLCLFNGRRMYSEIARMLSQITRTTFEQAQEFVTTFIKMSEELLVEREINDKYNPLDFMMPEKEVDTTKLRLLAPVSLVLLVTYNCKAKCKYCYANRKSLEDKKEMDLKFAKKIVDQAKDCNVELIYLGGGDPFFRKWIIDLIEYIYSHNIALILSTKEFLTIQKCYRLVRAGVRHLQVSIDSLSTKTADMLVGRKGFLQDILLTITNLQSVGIEVSSNSVVTKYNYRDIPKLVDFLIKRGIKRIILSKYGRSIYNHTDALFVNNKELKWLKRKIDLINKPNDVFIACPQPEPELSKKIKTEQLDDFINRAACAFGRTGLVITPSGKVIPCEQLPTKAPFIIGDLKKNNLQSVWNSEKLISMLYPDRSLFRYTACFNCEHFSLCIIKKGRCIRDIYKVYKSTVGVQPSCPKSTHTMRLT